MDDTKPREKTLAELASLADKANKDGIGHALSTLFIKPYVSVPLSLEFTMEMEDESPPEWVTRFDQIEGRILVQPLGVFNYIRRIRELSVTEDDYEDFIHCRYVSFLSEISKMPDMHLLFMLVLQRVAYMLEIAHLEKRGGIIEVAEGESYHTLLWAFKEVENFVRRTSGVNVRAHYRISWYEAEWITGR